MEHTKGPWICRKVDGSDRPMILQADEIAELCQGEPDPRLIASVGISLPSHGWDAEDWANGRLMAAAPELLAALKEAKQVLETAKQYFPKSIKNSDTFCLLNVLASSVNPALAKAGA